MTEIPTKHRLAAIKEQMGRLSREIGQRRSAGLSVDERLEAMRALSSEKRELEKDAEARREKHATGKDAAEMRAGSSKQDPRDTSLTQASANSSETSASSAAHSAPYPNPALTACDVAIEDEPASSEEWDSYVDSHPRGTLSHRYCWKHIIESAFGHATRFVVARRSDGALAGVLPLARQRSRLFGDFLISLPFLNHGGALGDSAEVEQALMRKAADISSQFGCRHVEFRDEIRRQPWPARDDKVAMRLALPDSAPNLWSAFSSKVRAQIRRAEREEPEVISGGSELVPQFYQVFARGMRDLGTPVYSRRFFETILEHVSGEARIVVVRLRDRPVSACLLLKHRQRMEIPWAASIRSANPLGMNMLMYWHALRHAIESGATEFDFGRSTVDSGTYRFKKQWGAQPAPLYWHYHLADGSQLPRLNPDNPKFRLAIACWKRLPLAVANRLGPPLVKYLP